MIWRIPAVIHLDPGNGKANIYAGEPIVLDREQYGRLRGYIQECAGRYVDHDDAIRAQIALNEVRRLDGLHGWSNSARDNTDD